MDISENVRSIKPSATLAVAARARELKAQGRDILDLSAGEPDLLTPGFVRRGGIESIEKGLTKYTAVAGIPQLRQAIARSVEQRTGVKVTAEQIVVSNGAKHALFNACFTLFGPGDRVLIPRPYWTSYPDIVRLARAEPVFVDGDPERGYKLSPDDLAKVGAGAKGIILNSPSNPSGAVYTKDELDAVVRWAFDHGLWIISDEIYCTLCYNGPRAASVYDLDPAFQERIVLIDGASKSFAMTGWRIGFSCSVLPLAKELAAVQSHMTSNPAAPSQYAALTAYTAEGADAEELRRMTETFHHRRDLIVSLFREELPELGFVYPDGAFYLFFQVPKGEGGSMGWCNKLLEEKGVALVPGEAFGMDDYVRLSFAASDDALREGVRRIAALVPAARA